MHFLQRMLHSLNEGVCWKRCLCTSSITKLHFWRAYFPLKHSWNAAPIWRMPCICCKDNLQTCSMASFKKCSAFLKGESLKWYILGSSIHYIILYYILLCYIILYYFISYCFILYYIILWYYIALYYTILYDIILNHSILSYIISYYIIS